MARPQSITANGNAQVDTAQSKFGGASALFDGNGDYLSVSHGTDLRFGTGNFTFEMWFRPNARTQSFPLLMSNATGWTANTFQLHDRHDSANTKITFWVNNFNNGSPLLTSTTSISNGTWYHVAIVRNGTSFKMYVNGTEEASATSSVNLDGSTGSTYFIGGRVESNIYYNGHIDEVRVSNTARYTANFTPATTAFSSDANTLLLIHADGTDASTTFTDDNSTGTVEQGAAVLSSAFTMSATGIEPFEDIYYIEDGYFTPDGYFVYITNAFVNLSSQFTISAELTESANFVDFAATLTSTVTQTTIGGRIQNITVNWSGVFASTMTVNASRDGDIDLNTDTVMSTVAVANRSTQITLANITNLNAQAARIVDSSSTMAAQSAITVDALDVIQFQATFPAVQANINTSKYLGDFVFSSGRPRTFTGGTYDSSVKQFGTHSLSGFVEGTFSSLTPAAGLDWMFEFWDKDIRDGCQINLGFLAINPFSSTDRRHIVRLFTGTGATFNQSTSPTPNDGAWNHWAIVKTGGRVSYYLNGSRWYTNTLSSSQAFNPSSYLLIGIGGTVSGGSPNRIDEVSLWIGNTLGYDANNSSITVPTAARVNNRNHTQALWHFDNNGVDDTSLIESLAFSVLNSGFNDPLLVPAQVTRNAVVGLLGNFAQTTTAEAEKESSADLVSDTDITVQISRSVEADLSVSAVSDITVTADVSREFSVTANTVTDQTATALVTRDFEVAQSSAFTSSITVKANRVGDSEFIVTATFTATAAKTADVAVTLDSELDQTTEVEVTRDAVIDLIVDSGQDTAIDRLRDIVSDLSSEFATAIAIDKFKDTGSDLTAEFTQTTIVQAIRDGASTLNVDTDISADTDRTRDTDLDLSTQIDITVTATRIKTADLALSVSLDQTTEAVKTTDVTVTEAVTVTQATSPVKTVDAVIDQDVIATQISVSALIANRESQLAATTAMTVVTGKLIDNTFKSAIGVSSDSQDENPDRTPFLKYGTSNSTGTSTQSKFVMSMWVYKPIGYIFDADPNRPAYIPSGTPGDLDRLNSSIRVGNISGVPFLYYYGQEGFAVWPLGSSRQELDQGYRHFLISVDLSKPTNSEKYRFWLDGQEVTGLEVYRISGVGAGTNFTLQTSAYNIPMLAYGQYHLMMNTTNVSPGSIEKLANNGSGYGDADQNLENRSGLTQFWWDYGGTYDLTQSGRLKFYNAGYVDLGEDGTNSGLASPKHYVRLLNIQDINEGGNQGGNWSWRKLRFTGQRLGDSLGPRIFVIDPATPTLDENSVGQLPGFRANFFLTAKTEGVFLYTATLTADTALTATGFRTLELTCDLTLDSDQLTQIGVIRQADSDLAVTADVTAQAVKTTDVESALTADTDLTAQVGDLDSAEADLVSAFALEVIGIKIDPERASALLQAESTLTTSADVIVNNEVIADSEFTLTADVAQIPPIRIEADLTVDTTLTVSIGAIEQFAILVASSGTLTVDAEALKDAILTLTAQTDQSTDADRVRSSTVTLNAGVFAVTAGDVINLDPQLTLVIEAETRNLLILPETRVFEVESETRTLIITKG